MTPSAGALGAGKITIESSPNIVESTPQEDLVEISTLKPWKTCLVWILDTTNPDVGKLVGRIVKFQIGM